MSQTTATTTTSTKTTITRAGGRAVYYSTRSIPPIMGGIQPCHPMIACAPLPPAPSPTTSRTPHFVEHRPRQTVLRQRYNLAQSKHAVAYCWRWRRTYFTLREDAEHAEVLVCIDTEIARHLTRSKHAIGACLLRRPLQRPRSPSDPSA